MVKLVKTVNLTLGPTYVFAVAPNVNDNFQSIGYSAEGGDLDNNTTGINEVQTAKGQFSGCTLRSYKRYHYLYS